MSDLKAYHLPGGSGLSSVSPFCLWPGETAA